MTAEPAGTVPAADRAPAVGLDAAALDAICPFHLAWGRELRTVQVGSVLARLRPGLADGEPLGASLRFVRPQTGTSFAQLREAARTPRLTVLEAVDDPRLRLRGELVPSADGEHVVFFGSLVVGDLDTATALGVSLRDFPAHDGAADFLLMARASATAIAEATELTDRLRRLNRELEDRVDERTLSLTQSRDRIALYALELEDVSARLREEHLERERVEEDLRLAHRLEAVGQLAAGVAHEINTPVQFVGDNLRFLGDALADLDRVLGAYARLADAAQADAGQARGALADAAAQVREVVEDADLAFVLEEAPRAVRESLEGMERVASIVRAMREFAQPDAQRRPTDLNHCVGTTLVVAHNEYRDCADVVTDLADDLPQVPCVPGEINQALLVLVVNAAQAIAEQVARGAPRGTITVRTRALPSSGEVEVSVRDTGGGIPDDVLPRIFDPFFTTKDVGDGTGQGLTTAHAIVSTRHGGRLCVSTEPGVGSEFTVRLPTA